MRRLLCQYLIIPEEYTEKKYSFPSHYNDDQQYGYRNSVRPSVCRSVRLSRSGIVSKRLNAPSYFLQLNHFRFSSRPTGRLCEIPTGSSLHMHYIES